MTDWVLDASALIALINEEPGNEVVDKAVRDGAAISTTNLAEVISRMVTLGMPATAAAQAASIQNLAIVELSRAIAESAGGRHAELRRRNIALADVICLETARALGATAVTADRAWADLPDQVRIIR